MTDIGQYLDFVLAIFFAFGIAFEMPVATFLLVQVGASSVESLSKKRPYIIVGVFVIGMFLTPPDIISQTLLAIPMWLLFEIGLIASRLVDKKSEDDEDEYRPLNDEEMETELDEIENEDGPTHL